MEAHAQADEPTRFPAVDEVSEQKMTLEFYDDPHDMQRVKTSCKSLMSDNVCRYGMYASKRRKRWIACCQAAGLRG